LNECIKKSHLEYGAPKELNDDQKDTFKKTIGRIRKHNERFLSGAETFYLGMNQFSHMSEKELKETILNLNPPNKDFGTEPEAKLLAWPTILCN
jgi:hypothetical protein